VGATGLSRFQYTLDRAGQRTQATETLAGQTRTVAYGYDGVQRLTSAVESPGTTYSYAYDLAGNRTQVQLNGVTTESRSYDAAGNLTSDGTATYTYDARNRLTQRGTTSYSYNGDDVLVAQATAGVTTRYTQDLASPLSQVLQTTQGLVTTDYLYGRERLAATTGAAKTWYLGDALGSVRLTANDLGLPLTTVNYDPWGTPEAGAQPTTFGFTGELQDVAAGLVNLRARWYSTGQGRFLTHDPFAGFPEQPYSQHPYQYGYSDPVLYTDLSGECGKIPDKDYYPGPCLSKDKPIDPNDPSVWKPTPAPPAPPAPNLLAVEQIMKDIWSFSIHPETQAISLRRAVGLGIPFCQVTFFGLDAYRRWINFVKTGGDMDVKGRYLRDFGPTLSLFEGEKKGWTYQLSGNLLFGFVGLYVRFTETELLDGGGGAQYKDHCVDKYNPGAIGPGAPDCHITNWSPRSWDKPSDQAEIEAGMALYKEFHSLFLTPYPQKLGEKRKALEQVLMRYRDRIPDVEK
jgi:RHS repeat-associated protein